MYFNIVTSKLFPCRVHARGLKDTPIVVEVIKLGYERSIYVPIYLYAHIPIYLYTYMCMYVCMHVCMYVCNVM